jgi:nickel-dependent lactate racemase
LTKIQLQTGAWYQDRQIEARFPDSWNITTHWPRTPDPLSDQEIELRLDQPLGCPPLPEQLAGVKKITIVVDDLSRPTPVYRVLPMLINRIRNVDKQIEISIIVATGTHGQSTRRIGMSSYKTPVFVNRTVLAADLVIGIGGVYPQHTTGFGGGGKLALGICGRKTIMGLHYKHKSMEGRYITDNDFRKDVTEIAKMIGLNSIVNLHINAYSEVVNVVFGDHTVYYEDAARFSKEFYTAPDAGDAELIVANAYPLDTSFTFMRKGYKPLYTAPRSAVKVMIAAAHEGIGVHGLFQYINPSRLSRIRNLVLRASAMNKRELLQKVWNRITRLFKVHKVDDEEEEVTSILPPNTDHLYIWRTDAEGEKIPELDGVTVRTDWDELLEIIRAKHFLNQDSVSTVVYACAPIQCIDKSLADHEF